jgi:hypothetical protein
MRIQLAATRAVGLVLYALVAVVAGQASAGDKPRVVERPVYVDSQAAVWRACEGLPGCEFLPLRGDAGREASEAIFRLRKR